MSKENKTSETAQQSGLSQVTATEETVTAMPHGIGLAELATSINLIGSEAASMTNLQAPLSSHTLRVPGSPERSDDKKSLVRTSPILGRPKRYALELWVEIEVSLDHFLPPEMTRSQKISQGNLLIRPILDALVCIWTGMVICWPFMARKAPIRLASYWRLLWKLVKLFTTSENGPDIQPGGEAGSLASWKLT